jgi:hypothetical protein
MKRERAGRGTTEIPAQERGRMTLPREWWVYPSYTVAKYWCMNWTAMEPSPTAEAQRLMEL